MAKADFVGTGSFVRENLYHPMDEEILNIEIYVILGNKGLRAD